MRGGQGDLEFTHIFQPENSGACRYVGQAHLGPDIDRQHVHTNEEEIFYILSGTPRSITTTQCQLGPGDALLTGGGQYHAVENAGPMTW